MPDRPSTAGIDLDTLREAAREAVDASSLRAVAREIGMSPTGLDRILKGSQPYRAITRKLNDWYLRTMRVRGQRLGPETAREVLSLLTDHLPPDERGGAMEEVLEALRSRTARAGAAVPPWLRGGSGR